MEENIKIRTKNGILIVFIILLFIPMLQERFQFVELEELHGKYSESPKVSFNNNNWFSGKFQLFKQDDLNENFGFRNLLVRTYNQFYFTVFNQARAKGITIGKDNYLYGTKYIVSYHGKDYVGEDIVKGKVNKLQKVSDTLKSKGVDLIVVLAPGKGTFYPEYFPEKDSGKPSRTNFDEYKEQLERTSIRTLDFNTWFLQMKDTSRFKLYPKNGVHWSTYGELLVMDSIAKYLSAIRPQNKMPEIRVKSIKLSTKMQGRDDDTEKIMNLFQDLPDFEMAYPNYEIVSDSTTNPPNVLTIGDSYFWEMYNSGITKKLFKKRQFWYYNRKIYPKQNGKNILVSEIDVPKEVETNDAVIIMLTDFNLPRFGFGFIDELYENYYNPNEYSIKNKEKKRINEIIKSIKADSKWVSQIKKKAEKNGISLEEAIRIDALYIINNESK